MEQKNKKLYLAGFVITFIGAILFSTKAIIVKKAFAETPVNAITLLALRMLFSLPFYIGAAIGVSRKATNMPMTRKQWGYTILIGLLGYYFSSLFDFLGLQYISAGLERLILFLYPTFVVLINTFVFRQKIYRMQTVALLLTYAGIAIAFLGELQIDTSNTHFIWGSFLVFMCAVTYSVYIVGSGRLITAVGVTKFTAYAMLAATAGILLHFAVTEPLNVLFQSGGIWAYGALLAIVATVVPSFMLSAGMKRIGSTNAAIISSIGPVSTIIQAHYILGEKIVWEQIAGTALVVVGILLLSGKTK